MTLQFLVLILSEMNAGILYVSTGYNRRKLLSHSLRSANLHAPELPVHVVTDYPMEIPFTWVNSCHEKASRFYKTQALSYSPFDLTLFLDDDTAIHQPLEELPALLGDADLAMVPDHFWPTMKIAISNGKHQRWMSHSEAEMMEANGFATDETHFNSGVILFRRTARSKLFFENWFREWCRFQSTDQFALYRALKLSGAKVVVLPSIYNCPFETVSDRSARIIHFLTNKNLSIEQYAKINSTEELREDRLAAAFSECLAHGSSPPQQYHIIGKIIALLKLPKIVVFGCGHDSLWISLLVKSRNGTVTFIEDKDEWIRFATDQGVNHIIKINFQSQIGTLSSPSKKYDNLVTICRDANLIIVDGPAGAKNSDPGREIPIWLARETASTSVVIVHDYDRPWERYCCDKYLGEPDNIISGKNSERQMMAIWDRGKKVSISVFK